MKTTPKLIIGSKQDNAYIGSVEDWCSCVTAACGMGGGHIPMVMEEIEDGDNQPTERKDK